MVVERRVFKSSPHHHTTPQLPQGSIGQGHLYKTLLPPPPLARHTWPLKASYSALVEADHSPAGEFPPGMPRVPTSVISCWPAGDSGTGFLPCFWSICGGGRETRQRESGGGGGEERKISHTAHSHTRTPTHPTHTHPPPPHPSLAPETTAPEAWGPDLRENAQWDLGRDTPFILSQAACYRE